MKALSKRAAKAEYDRCRYLEKRAAILDTCRLYRQNNLDKVSAKNRRYRVRMGGVLREKNREALRKWRLKHGKNYHRRWRDKNRGKANGYAAHYRARQFAATPPWLTEAQLRKIDSIYAEAAREGLEVDHIVPLGGKSVCGLHVPWNMQLLSADENKRKSNKSML